jgi:ribonuclease Y
MGDISSISILLALFSAAVVAVLFFIFGRTRVSKIKHDAKKEAEIIVNQAKMESEGIKKQADLNAQETVIKARQQFEESTRNKQQEIQRTERELMLQQEKTNRFKSDLRNKENEIFNQKRDLKNIEKKLEKEEQSLKELQEEAKKELEKISGMTSEEAVALLKKLMEKDARDESIKIIKSIEDDAVKNGQIKAQKVLSIAVQKSASDYVIESTVSAVDLPNDEMKGRIIGREGRNIRSLEMATGVDIIIDDTPEAILLSSFDPLRREVAKISIERLIADGRIHPGRIEEIVQKVRKEIDDRLREEGESIAMALNLTNIHPELLYLVGKLRYRTSYGQNLLEHSREVARLAGIMASELGANISVARRGGLLHDIGKAVDKDTGGTHVQVGVEIAKKFGEKEEVIHCLESHHFDVEPQTVEAVLVQTADTLSAARPGARREILETYIKRLEKLEAIADSYQGVNKAYAIQAGREVRIIVESDKVDDTTCHWLAKDISKRIEGELEYPGEIKVTVIREMRSIEYAR